MIRGAWKSEGQQRGVGRVGEAREASEEKHEGRKEGGEREGER